MPTPWRRWLRRTFLPVARCPRRAAPPASRTRVVLEALEDRTAPAAFAVTTPADVLDPGDGVLSLREAVLAANASAGVPDTITLPAGVYLLTRSGADDDSALAGDLDVTDTLTINGVGAAATVIGGNLSDRVFDLRAGALTLTRLTVRDGRVTGAGAQGGGIRSQGALALTDCVVTGNEARGADLAAPGLTAVIGAGLGGGIYALGGTVSLTGCTVSNNLAAGGAATYATTSGPAAGGEAGGGGAYVAGGTLTVTGSTVTGNRAVGGSATNPAGAATGGAAGGGGLAVTTAGAGSVPGLLTVSTSLISGNATEGGTGSALTAGTGGAADGGGVRVTTAGRHQVTGSTVANNRSSGGRGDGATGGFGGAASAGGLFFVDFVQLTSSTISGNQAAGGAALTAGSGPAGRAGDARGGGLLVGGGAVDNSTVTRNVAAAGAGNRAGGVGVGAGFASPAQGGYGSSFRSSILAGNVASTASPDIFLSAPFVSAGAAFTVIGDGAGATFLIDGFQGNQVGGNGKPVLDARLGPLADNGGPTPTHAPLTGSPAVNRGVNPDALATDQRGAGFPRVVGAGPDAGAVESPFTPPTATAGPLPDVTAAGGTAYTFTVTYADDVAVNIATLGSGDVVVTGPNGFSTSATLVAVDAGTNGTPRTATYRFTPPGGSWDAADYGTYTLSVGDLQVADTAGGYTLVATLGSFRLLLPTTFTVTNANDGGPGSLRDALAQANTRVLTADTIVFDPNFFSTARTITLTSGELAVTDSLTLAGPGADRLTIDANHRSRIFNIHRADPTLLTASVSGLRLTGGQTFFTGVTPDGTSIYVEGTAVTLTGCVVTGSSAGPAIYTDNPQAPLTVRDSSLSGNNSGAIFARGPVVIERTTVSNNLGPGVVATGNTLGSAPLTVINSTISENLAAGSSGFGNVGVGGIYAESALTIISSTIVNNNATGTNAKSGGIQHASGGRAFTLINSIVAGNFGAASSSGPAAPDIAAVGPVVLSYSAVGSPVAFTASADSHDNLPFGTDLRLGPLVDNGGPTLTRAPLAGSPLVNAGGNPTGLMTDQRGFARTAGTAPDIGAVEGVSFRPAAETLLAPVTAAGGTAYTFDVTYTDDVAIVVGTLGTGDIRVRGPNNFDALAEFVGVDAAANGTPRVATYRFTAPGGAWDSNDNGTYSVLVEPNQVADTDGRTVPALAVGSFLVSLDGPLVVTNTNDSGPGSLRDAVARANVAAGSANTITFDPAVFNTPRTITLTSGVLPVTDTLTIAGPGAALLTVSGNDASRILNVDGPGTIRVTVSGLTLTAGRTNQDDGRGGAIVVADENLTVADCVLTGNNAFGEGAAIGSRGGGGGSLTLLNSRLTNNKVVGNGFKQVVNYYGAAAVVRSCVVEGNVGDVMLNALDILVDGVTASGNTSESSGGLLLGATANARVTVQNCTISGNTGGTGGGIAVLGEANQHGMVVRVRNCTITGNTALQSGGGIFRTTQDTFVIESSIVAGNTSPDGPDIKDGGFFSQPMTVARSAIGSPAGFTLGAGSGNNLPFGTDLKLGPLQDNGGLTRTVALLPGSPAIDAGSNPAGLATDERGPGYVRTFGPATDIGAFEFQAPHVVGVAVNGGAAQRSRVTEVTVTFDAPVTLPATPAVAFRLTRNGPGGAGGDVALAVDLSGSTASRTVARLTFSGPLTESGSLVDGTYALTVFGGRVTGPGGLLLDGDGDGAAGGDYVTSLYRLYGDVNGDRAVNGADFALFRTAFGSSAADPNYSAAFDVNGDGFVNGVDFAAFRANFGRSI